MVAPFESDDGRGVDQTRFGTGRGAQLSHLIVVIYAFVSIIGFFTYGFKGIGKFAATFLPWHLSAQSVCPDPDCHHRDLCDQGRHDQRRDYRSDAILHPVNRFVCGGHHCHAQGRAGDSAQMVPAGWDHVFFGWHLNLDWSIASLGQCGKIAQDGYGLFGFFVMMLFFKGVLVSAAGPAPNYDMQRVLAAKNPREASMMSAWVNIVLTFPAVHSDHRTYRARLVFQRQDPRHGPNMDLSLFCRTALDVCAGRPAGFTDRRLAGGVHVQLCCPR
jgi:SSS family solute:Na+ symporter